VATRAIISPCRGCQGPRDDPYHHYCDACRQQRCPECRRFGGRHRPTCRYEQRQRRPPAVLRDEVSEAEVLGLYLAHREYALRLARSICGEAEGEDVVQDVALYMLSRRAYLNTPVGRAYFLRAVMHTALRRHLYGWARYVVAMDPDMLEVVEAAMARRSRLWSFRNAE
jgi:hypothetical protein